MEKANQSLFYAFQGDTAKSQNLQQVFLSDTQSFALFLDEVLLALGKDAQVDKSIISGLTAATERAKNTLNNKYVPAIRSLADNLRDHGGTVQISLDYDQSIAITRKIAADIDEVFQGIAQAGDDVYRNYEVYLTNVVQNLKIAVIIIIVLSILLVLFLAWLIRKPFTKIIGNLKVIAEGDLTQVITVNSKDEIGNLARYFNDTLDKIKSMIIIIKKQAALLHTIVTDLAGSMNQTATSINQITANIQIIKEQVLNQSAGVTETHATMEQVVTNIDKLNGHVENQSHHVAQASSAIEQNEMLEGAREVITESNNLEKVTAQITSGMNEMASGAEQINAAVNHVSELCGKTREGIDILMAEVSRFKVA